MATHFENILFLAKILIQSIIGFGTSLVHREVNRSGGRIVNRSGGRIGHVVVELGCLYSDSWGNG